MRRSILLLVALCGLIPLALAGRESRVLKRWQSLGIALHRSAGGIKRRATTNLNAYLSTTTDSSEPPVGESLELTIPDNERTHGASAGSEGASSKHGGTSGLFDNSSLIAVGASVGAIVVLAGAIIGLRAYMQARGKDGMGGAPAHKSRPRGLDFNKKGGAEEEEQKVPTSGRLQGERNKGKILVPQESKVDSTRSVNGGGERGDFFTLTDIDLVSPGKGKYTSPRV